MVKMILIGAALFVAACMAVAALGMLVFGVAVDIAERMEDKG